MDIPFMLLVFYCCLLISTYAHQVPNFRAVHCSRRAEFKLVRRHAILCAGGAAILGVISLFLGLAKFAACISGLMALAAGAFFGHLRSLWRIQDKLSENLAMAREFELYRRSFLRMLERRSINSTVITQSTLQGLLKDPTIINRRAGSKEPWVPRHLIVFLGQNIMDIATGNAGQNSRAYVIGPENLENLEGKLRKKYGDWLS